MTRAATAPWISDGIRVVAWVGFFLKAALVIAGRRCRKRAEPSTSESKVPSPPSTSVAVKALTTRLAQKLASGAAIRAAGGILGRSAGLVVAGVAGVAVDIAVRKLDELRNREGLEQALAALVDEEKEKLKSALSSEVDDVKLTALGDFIPSELR